MRLQDWARIAAVQQEFQKSLYYLCDMFDYIAKRCNNSLTVYQQKMYEFQQSDAFQDYVYSAVRRMVDPLSMYNMRTWREAARQTFKGQRNYNLLLNELQGSTGQLVQEQIDENARLIRTLPTDVAYKVAQDVTDYALTGMRSSEIAKIIRESTDRHSRVSARLIARTETSKTQSAITQARAVQMGVNWYVWQTQRDGKRVRAQHRIMQGVLVNYADPPSPEQLDGLPSVGNYHAGQIWNCRCYAEPLLDISFVNWPHKVYFRGKIQFMTKSQFERIM